MGVLFLERTLHTAKYIAVFNLAFCDLCGSSALIPKHVEMFLFDNQYISYEDCLANMFFVSFFMCLQSFSLLVLAYDRLVAICFPLRYHAIVTKTSMTMITGTIWVIAMTFVALLVGLITRLSFCRSTTVDSYFCDYGPIYKLACNDNTMNYIMSYVGTAALICIPLSLIILSYACIGFALLRISHGADRIKAMKTCTSHLILVAIFYIPITTVYITALTTYIHPNIRIINFVLTQTIPPMLNPIIYTLKTREILQSITVLYKRSKMKSTVDAFTEQLYSIQALLAKDAEGKPVALPSLCPCPEEYDGENGLGRALEWADIILKHRATDAWTVAGFCRLLCERFGGGNYDSTPQPQRGITADLWVSSRLRTSTTPDDCILEATPQRPPKNFLGGRSGHSPQEFA
ncbi:olfactory receptor 1500-like [Brachyhypopomus gauderio]|uniref:olfactory receptor 1500-like n=1 Tax=Brachyhypopomus gauderio TaxID=698409 RepID=UPI004041E1A6